MAELRAGLGDAIAGRGRLFLISGEPGIGKTRLTTELTSLAQPGGMAVWTGRCLDREEDVPYLPFVEILESCVEQAPAPNALRNLLGNEGPELARLMPKLRRIFPDLVPPLDLTPREARRHLFNCFCDFAARVATEQATVFIIEDLHWAEDSTLSLLAHLEKRLSKLPLLIVGTFRETELDVTPGLTKTLEDLLRGRLASRVHLKGLALDEVAAMLTILSGKAPPTRVVREIYDETEGNPFFVEELFLHLKEENRLYDSTGAFRPKLKVGELDAPRSVRLVIGQRLARLSDPARKCMATAAAIGRFFSFETLQAASVIDPDSLIDCLEEAEKAGLICASADSARARLEFSHELTRQAVLAALTAPRRERLHLQVAEAIERICCDALEDHFSELAYHYCRSTNAAKAIEYSMRAAAAAAAAFAFHEANAWRDEALRLSEPRHGDPLQRAEILTRLFGTTRPGHEAQTVRQMEEALAIYERLELPAKAADVHARLVEMFCHIVSIMDLARAEVHFRKAEALLHGLPVSKSLARLYINWSWTCLWRVQAQSAYEAAGRALEIAERLDSPSVRAAAGVVMGACLWAMGQLRRGFELHDRAWEEADRINDPSARGATTNGIFNLRNLCDYKEALRWSKRECGRPHNKESGYNELYGFIGEVRSHAAMGQLDEVRRLMREAPGPGVTWDGKSYLTFWAGNLEEAETRWHADVDFARRQERFENVCTAGWLLAHIQRLAGHHTKAEGLLLEGLSYSVPGGYVALEMPGRQCLAQVYAELNRTDEARTELARCREIMEASEDWRGLAGMVEWSEAALAVAEKRLADADRHFVSALEIMCRYSMSWLEGPALRDWGRALFAAGQRERALAKFDEAIELYRHIGAGQPWIDPIVADKQKARV
jgi:tetratricopeptide (TPR) repeat protein